MQHKVASQFIDKPTQAQSFSREFCAHIYKVRRLDFSLLDCADACTNGDKETYIYEICMIMQLLYEICSGDKFLNPNKF